MGLFGIGRTLVRTTAAILAVSVLAASCATSPSTHDLLTPPAEAPVGVKLRMIEGNGVKLRIAEMGSGPLVILVHGWPESWYSWRHQMTALAAAGYHVVAPDMRGYGASGKPGAVEDYDIRHVSGDLVAIVDAMGEKSAALVAHDWGAIVAWNTMLLHPDRFSALAAMSVPFNGRAAVSPLETMRKGYGENFYYILYFQEPGVAEAEFDADPRGVLSRLYKSPDTPLEAPTVTDPKRAAGGWIARNGLPKERPAWLSASDLDYYVGQYTEAGFKGGINYYRNFHRNWEITPELTGAVISQPVMFIAGQQDTVIRGATAEGLKASMGRVASDLRGVTLIPGAGHWIQQEKPNEVNAALIAFFAGAGLSQPAK